MTFLNIYVQPLSLYPGAIIAFNYLYERHELFFYEKHNKHLLSIFYCNKTDDKKHTVMIHLSASLKHNQVERYFIRVYNFTNELSELYSADENTIKDTVDSTVPIWESIAENQFLLFFQLRKLSYNIGRRLSINKKLEASLSKFDIYKEEVINSLANGMKNVLQFICEETELGSYDIERNFLTSLMTTHHDIVHLKNWHSVWQLYYYQQDHTAWHEAVKWIRKEISDYRKHKAISNLIIDVLKFKSA